MKPMQPPHSIEAEQSLLGGLMRSNQAFDEIASIVGARDFYRAENQVIFGGIAEMLLARKPCDFVTLVEHLRNRGQLEESGGTGYIGSLAMDSYSIANVVQYAGVVREQAVLRGMISAGAEIGDMGYRPAGRTVPVLMDEAERLLFELRSRATRAQSGPQSYASFVAAAESDIERQHRKGGGLGGLSTGIPELDRKTDGLHPGDLVIIAARPALGKTTLAMNIAENVALDQKRLVVVFSMEMQGAQIAQRTIARRARVSMTRLRGGNLVEQDWERITAVSGDLRTDLLRLDESPALSPMDIRARSRRQASMGQLALIVVDYLQLMAIPGSRENRNGEISQVTRSLKALAKELRVPIIALSQLSRAGEKDGRRPKLSDLRDSGGIEADADVVLFVHRDELLAEEGEVEQQPSAITEIIIGKQRQGQSHAIVRLKFLGEYCAFTSLDQEDWDELKRQRAGKVKVGAGRGFGKLAAAGDA